MGNPLHFSLELPQRCLQLIEELWPYAEKTRQADHPLYGPLTTTFLISMSMPIINLPIERIERQSCIDTEGYADDRHIDPKIAAIIRDALGGRQLRTAPFFVPDSWSFSARPKKSLFNVARKLPDDVAEELASKEAAQKAAEMPASQWCSIIRNSMAHGGIVYLDSNGRTSYGEPVSMYAFVSGKYDGPDFQNLIGINVLRISQKNYRAFLIKWVAWLRDSGALNDIAA